MVKVYAVRVGDKYGVEHEEYLKSKLPDVTFLRDSQHPFLRQWNKLRFMEIDTDDPICVIDLDIELMNDYMELFEYPLQRGEFVGIPSWWKDTDKPGYELNGGFYKYYPKIANTLPKSFVQTPESGVNITLEMVQLWDRLTENNTLSKTQLESDSRSNWFRKIG